MFSISAGHFLWLHCIDVTLVQGAFFINHQHHYKLRERYRSSMATSASWSDHLWVHQGYKSFSCGCPVEVTFLPHMVTGHIYTMSVSGYRPYMDCGGGGGSFLTTPQWDERWNAAWARAIYFMIILTKSVCVCVCVCCVCMCLVCVCIR